VEANGLIFAGLLGHLFLLGLPLVAAALVAVRYRVHNVPLVIGIALAVSGITAFASFWAYYADPTVGKVWDFVVLFAALELGVLAVWKGELDRPTLRRLATPFALWVLGSFFVAYFGFIHGGVHEAVTVSSTRFTGQLPSDNDIPRFFAEWFATHGHSKPPIYPPDWLMSDRPPLQVGYVLAERSIVNSATGLHYELIGLLVQQLWIPAMWAVLVAARLRPATRSLAMFAAIVSDIGILYAFYVWPKLIAAAFLLVALAIVISPEWKTWRRDPRVAALVGVLLALSLLSHGSSIFGVIPLALFAVFRGLPSWRWVAVLALCGAVAYVPWMAYQHYADPPGNRLLKWQLGGQTEADSRGTLEAIEDGYELTGFDGVVEYKLANFGEMIGTESIGREADPATRVLVGAGGWVDGFAALKDGELGSAIAGFRGPRFFSLLPMLGILLVAPFAMLLAYWKRRPRDEVEWRFALLGFAFFVIACVIWGLLLFGNLPARTTIHVGSLTVPLIGICACVAGMRATYPRLALAIVAINVVIVLVTYTPSLTPPPGSAFSPIAAVIAALSLAGIGWLLRDGLYSSSAIRGASREKVQTARQQTAT
jgi:hypothetical protein